MDISDFDFTLPDRLIAQHPPEVRGSSRLLVALPDMPLQDRAFGDLPDYIEAGDVLVFNNTKVMKARLFGQKESGGKIEALIERVLDNHTALAHIRSSKSPKPGTKLIFEGDIRAVMVERADELFCLRFEGGQTVYELLEQNGHLPLPPYIERAAGADDDKRYQTVYAKHQGAVAAPTAGLHFTDELHSEWFDVPPETVAAIEAAHARGNKVWAVGTTSMRALESAARETGCLKAGQGDTDIFITPGYRFRVIDRLITNFHLPKSTLLMLVCAFSGMEHIRAVYRHAVEHEYRFFSYGDAMVLGRSEP